MGAKTIEIIPSDDRGEVLWEYVEDERTAAEPTNIYFNGTKLDNHIYIDVHEFNDDLLTVEVEIGDGTDAKPDTVYVEFDYPAE
ncbi:MAG: hypothetical protein ABEJ72_04025 [Candidatus Aenigmatarchaeota archaeon]